jgi:hypothetical protein
VALVVEVMVAQTTSQKMLVQHQSLEGQTRVAVVVVGETLVPLAVRAS